MNPPSIGKDFWQKKGRGCGLWHTISTFHSKPVVNRERVVGLRECVRVCVCSRTRERTRKRKKREKDRWRERESILYRFQERNVSRRESVRVCVRSLVSAHTHTYTHTHTRVVTTHSSLRLRENLPTHTRACALTRCTQSQLQIVPRVMRVVDYCKSAATTHSCSLTTLPL